MCVACCCSVKVEVDMKLDVQYCNETEESCLTSVDEVSACTPSSHTSVPPHPHTTHIAHSTSHHFHTKYLHWWHTLKLSCLCLQAANVISNLSQRTGYTPAGYTVASARGEPSTTHCCIVAVGGSVVLGVGQGGVRRGYGMAGHLITT